MKTRIALCASAILAMLVMASPVHAEPGNVIANFAPSPFQMVVTVTSTDNIFAKQCSYSASNPLLPKVSRNFSLTPGGSQTLTFPGPPTGTSWRVVIVCDYVGGPSGQSGGSFVGDVTY
jgi:hypothetical protein